MVGGEDAPLKRETTCLAGPASSSCKFIELHLPHSSSLMGALGLVQPIFRGHGQNRQRKTSDSKAATVAARTQTNPTWYNVIARAESSVVRLYFSGATHQHRASRQRTSG